MAQNIVNIPGLDELKQYRFKLEIQLEAVNSAIRSLEGIKDSNYSGNLINKREMTIKTSYSNMTVPQAIVAYLTENDGPATTAEITAALVDGGIETEAEDFKMNVYAALSRMKDDRVIKVNDKWTVKLL
jgi:hypothetical protein